MVNCKRLSNGNLLITAGNETRKWITEHKDLGEMNILGQLFEPYFTNGSYEPFDAGQANPFVGLTDAPCIAESMDYTNDGKKEITGDWWYFANYMLVDPIAELQRKGRVIFTLAR